MNYIITIIIIIIGLFQILGSLSNDNGDGNENVRNLHI